MRILHTADWHIGCHTDDFLRLPEQYRTCQDIVDIANLYDVDMVVIAGDIYDTFLPSAESEKLVFDTLTKLSNNGNRAVIGIAGNHDEPKRLSNANVFCNSHNIYLVGQMDKIDFVKNLDKDIVPIDSGIGYIEFKTKQNEDVVVATMPYPSYYRYKQIKRAGETLNDSIKEWFKPALSGFRKDTINIAVSHLLSYPTKCTSNEYRFYEVVSGKESFVDRENLYSLAHYTALGHLHQNLAVDKAHHIYYSGATVNKYFDDNNEDNVVLIVDIDQVKGVTNIQKIPVFANHLAVERVSSIDQAINFLKNNSDKFIKLIFENMDYVNPSDINKLRKEYKNIITISVEPKLIQNQIIATKKDLTTKEIFENFIKDKTGNLPDAQLTELFLKLMGEIVYEAD